MKQKEKNIIQIHQQKDIIENYSSGWEDFGERAWEENKAKSRLLDGARLVESAQ